MKPIVPSEYHCCGPAFPTRHDKNICRCFGARLPDDPSHLKHLIKRKLDRGSRSYAHPVPRCTLTQPGARAWLYRQRRCPRAASAGAESREPARVARPSRRPQPCDMSSFVRLRGLPFQSTEQDVAQWFACTPGGPISITRVLFTYNNAGRKSGEAVRAPRPCATCPIPLTPAPACVSAVCGAA